MGKPLSIDLRERIIRSWQSGHSRRQVARLFMVAPSVVIKLVHLFETTGTFAPKKMGGDRRSKLKAHKEWLLQRVEEIPDISLWELAEQLKARDVDVHISNISRFLIANGLSYKKNASGHRARSTGCS